MKLLPQLSLYGCCSECLILQQQLCFIRAFLCRKFHKKLGQQAWLVAAITATEFLIVVKYDPYTLTLSLPFYITQCWILGIILVLTWTAWRFFIR